MLNSKIKPGLIFLGVFFLITNQMPASDITDDLSSTLGIPFFKVFDPSKKEPADWHTEGKADEILFWSHDGIATLEVLKTDRSWGALFKTVSVNLDRHPLLQINVLSATKKWYLIIGNPGIPNGYIRLIETDQTGSFTFDVSKVSNLTGRHKLDVKIGISGPDEENLINENVSFNKLIFTTRQQDHKRKSVSPSPQRNSNRQGTNDSQDTLILFHPDGTDIDLWEESLKDGPQEEL